VRSFACFVKMKEGKEEADEKEGGDTKNMTGGRVE
jgi:hypothetical protein